MSRVSVKMVQKFSTRFTGTVVVLLDIVVTFSVKDEGLSFQYTKVCSFLRTCDRNCMERGCGRGEGRDLWSRLDGLGGIKEGMTL